MTQKETPLTPRGRLWFGLTFVLFGIFPMLATFDIGPLGVQDINGPPWLGVASGGAFVAGGLAVLAGPGRPLLNAVLAICVIGALAALGNWIAFGVGERVCGVSLVFWGGGASGLGCRIPFGIGAVITNAMLVLFVVLALQKALGGPPRLARQLGWAENLLFLSLAPILVPLVLLLFGRVAFDVLKTRLQTGQWSRNKAFIKRQHKFGQPENHGKKP